MKLDVCGEGCVCVCVGRGVCARASVRVRVCVWGGCTHLFFVYFGTSRADMAERGISTAE